MGSIGWQELLIVAIIGVLIFGKRLPSVGRSVGQSIVEFKKGLAGVDEQTDAAKKQADHQAAVENTETKTPATAGGAA